MGEVGGRIRSREGHRERVAASPDTTTRDASIHVIVLGASGGPKESNVTAMLVRSVASDWRRGSVIAVDAGVHLGAIEAILQNTQPTDLGKTEDLALPYTLRTGPFAGFALPHATASQNALHFHQTVVEGFIITHPHLDHINGMIINTAAAPGGRAKRVAGLPYTISTLKTDIFNNRIWPNLTDENNGAGLVTFSRLLDGGSPVLGEGDGRGYLEICDGLLLKMFSVSHGTCIERHAHRGSQSSSSGRHGSFDASSGLVPNSLQSSFPSPRTLAHHNALGNASLTSLQHQERQTERRSSHPGTVNVGPVPVAAASVISANTGESICVSESSASFLRDSATGREVLIFGDVEPDSISLSPRNRRVWQEAAPKIVAGHLAAIFIECSYDDSQPRDCLYGHLTPRFLVEEMAALAAEVRLLAHGSGNGRGDRLLSTATAATTSTSGYASDTLKRKRQNSDAGALITRRKTSAHAPTSVPQPPAADDAISPKTARPPLNTSSSSTSLNEMADSPHLSAPTAELSLGSNDPGPATPPMTMWDDPTTGSAAHAGTGSGDRDEGETEPPLRGIKVVVIHVKDKMNGGEPAEDKILRELRAHEEAVGLGCEFVVARSGEDFYL